jgi:microcin C transport system permease protein
MHGKASRAAVVILGISGAVAFLAPLIANDKPVIIYYKGQYLFPALRFYPESRFGGFLAVPDYQEPEIQDEIKKNGWIIWPPIRYYHDTINKDYPRRQWPNGACIGFPGPPNWLSVDLCEAPGDQLGRYHALGNWNWLGTDDQGRDVLSQLIYGTRGYLGIVAVVVSVVLAATFAAAYLQWVLRLSGKVVAHRSLVWIGTSMPALLVMLTLASFNDPEFIHQLSLTYGQMIVLFSTYLAFSRIPATAAVLDRLSRADYARVSFALGASRRQVWRQHMRGPALQTTLMEFPTLAWEVMLLVILLGYVGVRLPAGTASLGALFAGAKNNLYAPWLLIGVLPVLILGCCFAVIGQSLQRAIMEQERVGLARNQAPGGSVHGTGLP